MHPRPLNDDMIRACLDTNVFISALLVAGNQSTNGQVVARMAAGEFSAVVANLTLDELHAKVKGKRWLAARISDADLQRLVRLLHTIADIVEVDASEIRPVTRDPKDDYLLSPAVRARADYVVSGDKDLQVLGEVEGVKILSPTDFLALLDDTSSSPGT